MLLENSKFKHELGHRYLQDIMFIQFYSVLRLSKVNRKIQKPMVKKQHFMYVDKKIFCPKYT